MRNGIAFEKLADRPAVCVDAVQQHVDAMARQVLCQLLGGAFCVENLLVGDRNDVHLPGPFEQGKRVGDRPGRGATKIPGDGDGSQFERARTSALRQDKGRPARSENHRLGVPLIIRYWHRYDREIAEPGIIDQQIGNFEGRAFFHECLVQNAGLCRGCVKCSEHISCTRPALFGLARDNARDVGDRTWQEVPGYLNMHFAGDRGKVSAEGFGD